MERLEGIERAEGVASAFAATRDGIDTMLRDRGLRSTSPDLTGESLMRGAHASAVLDGSASTLDEVRAAWSAASDPSSATSMAGASVG